MLVPGVCKCCLGESANDTTSVVQGERRGKLAWPLLSRRPHSPLHLFCNGKVTTFAATVLTMAGDVVRFLDFSMVLPTAPRWPLPVGA